MNSLVAMRNLAICLFLLIVVLPLNAAPKIHTITVGKSMKVKWPIGPDESQTSNLAIRPLLVDGHMRGYVTGPFHDVTERMFVARRAFRINDDLPQENPATPHWLWQRGGWILVDRLTGHIVPVVLPGFDSYYSVGEWYRGYYAYCAVSDDGKQTFAVVAELGRRKPVLKQSLGKFDVEGTELPDSACAAPLWQRQPVRVTFKSADGQQHSFTLRGEMAGGTPTPPDDEDKDKDPD